MTELGAVQQQIARMFCEKLNLDVPSPDTDLLETGALDSMAFVEVLVYLEREFGVTVSIDELEIDNFRSVARIADFVSMKRPWRAARTV